MIVGIDLGTTNSLIAYYSDEGAKIIPNRLGKHLTPSVVGIDGDTVLVGETAKEYGMLYPDRVADVFKRSMEQRENTVWEKRSLWQRSFLRLY